MILIVTGGRDYNDRVRVDSAIMEAYDAHVRPGDRALNIWHGGATGADALAGAFADANRCSNVPFPADWKGDGRAAGPKRNERMVALAASHKRNGHTVVVLAFPGGRGTADCVRRAKAHGLPVVTITPMGEP